jgi:TRAP-type C4-dicarboxylate transport system permease small subunit
VKINSTSDAADWNASFWFAVSSPFLGVLLGILALAIFFRSSKQRRRGLRKRFQSSEMSVFESLRKE